MVVQKSAPLPNNKKNVKWSSLTLQDAIKPRFSDMPLLDNAYRQLSTHSSSTRSFASNMTDFPQTNALIQKEEEEQENKAEEESKNDDGCQSPVVQSNLFDIMQKYGDEKESWDFDVFGFMDDPLLANKGLVYLSFYLFRRTGLLESTGVSQPHLWRFLEAVEMGYLDNPYHNKLSYAIYV